MLIIIYNLFFLWFLILSYQRTMFLWVQTVREDKKSFRKAIFDIFSSGSKEKWEMLTFPGHHQRSTTILIKFSFFQNLFNCCLFLWSEKFFLRILFCLLIAFTYPEKTESLSEKFRCDGCQIVDSSEDSSYECYECFQSSELLFKSNDPPAVWSTPLL